MIEELVMMHLEREIDVSVYTQRPGNKPGEYIVIEKTGGSSAEHIRSAVLAVQSYADSLFKAAQLNERVIAAMEQLAGLGAVTDCRLNSDYNFTDPATKKPRYQAIFDIHYY